MRYNIRYSCLSHIGNVRTTNQDNYFCNGHYVSEEPAAVTYPLNGYVSSRNALTFAVFDGMGGEECGEIASYIASKNIASLRIRKDTVIKNLLTFCHETNCEICRYTEAHHLSGMGTTAAILTFTSKEIVLCNIGDSKIFRLSDGHLEQISTDHIGISAFGVKPPLLQNLGIQPSELIIDPYFAKGEYHDGDLYLICSDGLTDMVSTEEITDILMHTPFENATSVLLESALAHGGKDNITMIACKLKRQSWHF